MELSFNLNLRLCGQRFVSLDSNEHLNPETPSSEASRLCSVDYALINPDSSLRGKLFSPSICEIIYISPSELRTNYGLFSSRRVVREQ
ncbi:hypothetical protein CEXT_313141 [Caerostris extrusa]|uniref:Ycf15 n=1 Tax=Caerostris extrusa TaxID=172846 RepID=A0AAV4MBP4_CAEEX|nr:hypothetical protein CEXT_313141 [Caerostris extrusa]